MVPILLKLPENMLNHINDFNAHYRFRSKSEAIRELILAGFKAYGNPLNETFDTRPGRRSAEKVENIAKQERYKQIQEMLKLNGINLDDNSTDD